MHGNIWCDTYCLLKEKMKTKRPTFAFKLKSNVAVWVWGAEYVWIHHCWQREAGSQLHL